MNKRTLYILLIILSQLSFVYSQTRVIDSLKQVITTTRIDTLKVNALNDLSWELRNSDPTLARDYATQAFTLAENIGYEKGAAWALRNQGVMSYFLSDHDRALELYKEADVRMERIGDKAGAARIKNNIAILYDIRGEFENALNYYLEYLKSVEMLGDKEGTARANNNIGLIYFRIIDRDTNLTHKAAEHFNKALDIRKEINDISGVASSLNNLGLLFQARATLSNQNPQMEQAYLDSAMANFQEALRIRQELGEQLNYSSTLASIAGIESKRGKHDIAIQMYEQAVSVQTEIGDRPGLVHSFYNLGFIYSNIRKFDMALKYFEKSMSAAEEINYKDMVKANSETMSMLYDSLGNYKMALKYHRLYSEVKDQLLNDESQKLITEMKSKYDLEKKENENKILQQENELGKAKLQQNKIVLVFVGIAVAFLLAFAVFILRSNRQKQKANELLLAQKTEIETQRDEIDIKNKHITDSIRYAQRIQQAILPPEAMINRYVPEGFILFKPKDIVSGDFYWLDKIGDVLLFSAVDCTGHGVPGAFMSIVGSSILNQAVHEKNLIKPNEILNFLGAKIFETLQRHDDENSVKDGMDLALCALNYETMILEFAGVHNPMYIIRNNEVLQFKPDKHPIGEPFNEEFASYENTEIPLQKNDIIYVFSDGMVDQFGGPNRKKFLSKRFRETLLEIQTLSMTDQKNILNEVFEEWRGDIEQYDDVCIIGIKV